MGEELKNWVLCFKPIPKRLTNHLWDFTVWKRQPRDMKPGNLTPRAFSLSGHMVLQALMDMQQMEVYVHNLSICRTDQEMDKEHFFLGSRWEWWQSGIRLWKGSFKSVCCQECFHNQNKNHDTFRLQRNWRVFLELSFCIYTMEKSLPL